MTPIDQIRKALESGETLGFYIHETKLEPTVRVLHWTSGGCRPATDSECALWDALDAAVQRVAELEKQVEAVTNVANAAMKGSAEMQERCATEAWNHFMEVCKRFGVPPTGREDWCAARAIRAIKE